MKLTIQSNTVGGQEELRTLLIDNLETLAGAGSRLLESRLPWEGHPILLTDRQLHPVLVSFDTESADVALVDGLQAAERLSSALAWVNQVYEQLQGQQKPLRLVVVSREIPAGADSILAHCPCLQLFRYKALRVNEQTGLWLEPLDNGTAASAADNSDSGVRRTKPRFPGRGSDTPPVQLTPVPAQKDSGLPALSDAESSFFQQL